MVVVALRPSPLPDVLARKGTPIVFFPENRGSLVPAMSSGRFPTASPQCALEVAFCKCAAAEAKKWKVKAPGGRLCFVHSSSSRFWSSMSVTLPNQ